MEINLAHVLNQGGKIPGIFSPRRKSMPYQVPTGIVVSPWSISGFAFCHVVHTWSALGPPSPRLPHCARCAVRTPSRIHTTRSMDGTLAFRLSGNSCACVTKYHMWKNMPAHTDIAQQARSSVYIQFNARRLMSLARLAQLHSSLPSRL